MGFGGYGGIKIWDDAVKDNELDVGGNYNIVAGSIPSSGKLVFVELTMASGSLRDQEKSSPLTANKRFPPHRSGVGDRCWRNGPQAIEKRSHIRLSALDLWPETPP